MTHRERVSASLRGVEVDRPAISLWRHFGGIDMTAGGLAEAMIGFQRTFDFDFVKFMPTGSYTIMDWGAETTWEPNDWGTRTIRRLPIANADDWPRLRLLDRSGGVLGVVNDALAQTVEEVGPSVPVLQTIFSPLSTAGKLAGPSFVAHLRQSPDVFAAGLSVIEEVTRGLIADAIERGADLFYVVQTGTANVLTEFEFERWESEAARRLLGALPEDAIAIVHGHGNHLWFQNLADWPVQGLNWDDRTAGPTLHAARMRTTKGLVGGIAAWSELRDGRIQDVRNAVAAAVGDGQRGVVVGPGCAIPTDAAAHLIQAARSAVEDPRVVRRERKVSR